MHLYMFTRGQFDKVRDMMQDLQAQYLTYQTGITPQDKKMVQLGVRPIQLWEIAFPKEHLQFVMRTIGPMNGFQKKDKRPLMKMLNIVMKLKKYLGLKDVPEIEDMEKGIRGIIRRFDVDVKAVGIKEDQSVPIEQI